MKNIERYGSHSTQAFRRETEIKPGTKEASNCMSFALHILKPTSNMIIRAGYLQWGSNSMGAVSSIMNNNLPCRVAEVHVQQTTEKKWCGTGSYWEYKAMNEQDRTICSFKRARCGSQTPELSCQGFEDFRCYQFLLTNVRKHSKNESFDSRKLFLTPLRQYPRGFLPKKSRWNLCMKSLPSGLLVPSQ